MKNKNLLVQALGLSLVMATSASALAAQKEFSVIGYKHIDFPMDWRQYVSARNDTVLSAPNTSSSVAVIDDSSSDNSSSDNSSSDDGSSGDSNTAPTSNDDSVMTGEEEEINLTALVLANDSDPDGDYLSIVSTTSASNGSVSLSSGQLTYDPNYDFYGSDDFTYTIEDSHGNQSTSTVFVTVNGGPDAEDDDSDNNNEADADSGETEGLTDHVLSNDSDPEGENLTITAITEDPDHGVAWIENGLLYYKSDDGFDGTDSFEYEIQDAFGNSDVAGVDIDVKD